MRNRVPLGMTRLRVGLYGRALNVPNDDRRMKGTAREYMGRAGRTERNAERREQRLIPNGAKFQRAPDPERRQIPNGGTAGGGDGGTATTGARTFTATRPLREWLRAVRAFVVLRGSAVRDSAPLGIWRSSGFGAVRDSDPLSSSLTLWFLCLGCSLQSSGCPWVPDVALNVSDVC